MTTYTVVHCLYYIKVLRPRTFYSSGISFHLRVSVPGNFYKQLAVDHQTEGHTAFIRSFIYFYILLAFMHLQGVKPVVLILVTLKLEPLIHTLLRVH